MRNWRAADLDTKVTALIGFAEKLTLSPSSCVRNDIELLHQAGWDDASIHDAVQIVSYFNYINRVADALGVELDEGIPTWGHAP